MKRSRITSPANPLVRDLARGGRGARGGGERAIILEGPHLLQAALASDRVTMRQIFALPSWLEDAPEARIIEEFEDRGARVIIASESVIRKLSSTVTPQGVLGAGDLDAWRLDDIRPRTAAFVIACDGVRDPGNLGTMIRTADAAGADGVVILPGCADPCSAKTLRSSAGSFFNLPVAEASLEAFSDWADDRGVRILGADAGAEKNIYEMSFLGPVSLVFGNEGSGLGGEVRRAAHDMVSIPISGAAESLNVTAAAAIAAFEVVRQRMTGA